MALSPSAVSADREALKEWSRERVPLDWAMSVGNQGIALMHLAERRGDAAMAEAALSQINAAFEMMRNGGNSPSATYYEQQLPNARALVARLRGDEAVVKEVPFLLSALVIGSATSDASAQIQRGQIKADTGAVAIGGSVRSSTIITGIPQEKVDELVREQSRRHDND